MAKTIPKDTIDTLCPGLWEVVDEFLKKTPHRDGNGGPFTKGLGSMEMPEFPRQTVYVVPQGVTDEDIFEIDNDFNAKLMVLGRKYSLQLRLPPWAYPQ